MIDPGGYIPGVDGVVDVIAECDIITPVLFWALPGVALEFEPPAGRSATDVLRHLRKMDIRLGWPTPLLAVGETSWAVKIPEDQADDAEKIMRRMK